MAGGAGGPAWGGGLDLYYGSLSMSQSTVANNRVIGGTGGMGGLGYASNVGGPGGAGGVGGAAQGGGILTAYPTVSLSTSTVSNNTVSGGYGGAGGNGYDGFSVAGNGGAGGTGGVGQGAGLFVISGQVTVTNATLALNTATGGAGGAGGHGGSNQFSTARGGNGGNGGNGGVAGGGGIYLDAGTLKLTNDTIASNNAQASTGGPGGLAGVGGAGPGINGSAGTGQSGQGGGALVVSKTTVNAINTLFGDNQAGAAPDFSGNFTKASHNFLEDGTGSNLAPGDPDSTGNIVGTSANPIDPMLGPLASNGGPTQTMALSAGSPCLDAGTSQGASTTDQRGVHRGNPPDIGAFELEPSGPSVRSTAVVQLKTNRPSVRPTAVVDLGIAGVSVGHTTVVDPSDLTVRLAALDALLAEGAWTHWGRARWHHKFTG
jgi:hypothetical protein